MAFHAQEVVTDAGGTPMLNNGMFNLFEQVSLDFKQMITWRLLIMLLQLKIVNSPISWIPMKKKH